MIFFVIDTRALSKKDFSSITTSVPVRKEPWAKWAVDLPIMIAWNEVKGYESPLLFVNALLLEASKDPVAQGMMEALKADYGIDLLEKELAQPTVNMVMDVFYAWSHPLTGNIASSPQPRPSDDEAQLLSWKRLLALGYISQSTIGAMEKLIVCWAKEVGPLDRSHRDQVRVHYNITEAARAFIGEVTSEATKRLEKLLALRLVRSGNLWVSQVKLLTLYVQTRWEHLASLVPKKGLGAMEYTRYYLPALKLAKGDEALQLLIDLINSASDGDIKPKAVSQVNNKQCLQEWEKLPLVIRCSILINDLRKLDGSVTDKLAPPKRTCLSYSKLPATNARHSTPYTAIYEPSSKNHALGMTDNKGGDLRAWSWNRNEYAETVITYRLNLCPLWGGSSGHTGGGIQHWMTAFGNKAPASTAVTVACSLFVLWRLYYDKRLSPVHTMTEVFEATFNDLVTGGKMPVLKSNTKLSATQFKDAFDLITACSIKMGTGHFSIDPILVFRSLRSMLWKTNGHEGMKKLKTLIDQERKYLSLAHWLPQWSHELSQQSGTNVKAFDVPLTEKELTKVRQALSKK